MYALKRRLICGSFLLLVILGSVVDLHGEHSGRAMLGPSLLGLASGLLLGVIHIPDAWILTLLESLESTLSRLFSRGGGRDTIRAQLCEAHAMWRGGRRDDLHGELSLARLA